MIRSLMKAAPVLGLLAVLPACGGDGSGPPGAGRAAELFHAAVQAGDYAQACSMLAPATLESAQRSGNGEAQPCTDQLRAVSLAAPGKPVSAQAFGRNAQVVFEADTVFLTLSDGTWKVMAAGCTSRGERPYSCLVEGD
ncbi:MAG: hypothetical protein ABS910_14440 [Arthrobacter sp.]